MMRPAVGFPIPSKAHRLTRDGLHIHPAGAQNSAGQSRRRDLHRRIVSREQRTVFAERKWCPCDSHRTSARPRTPSTAAALSHPRRKRAAHRESGICAPNNRRDVAGEISRLIAASVSRPPCRPALVPVCLPRASRFAPRIFHRDQPNSCSTGSGPRRDCAKERSSSENAATGAVS